MKKFFAILISLAMLLSLSACGETSSPQSPAAPVKEDVHGDKYALPLNKCEEPTNSYFARKNNLTIETVNVSSDEDNDGDSNFSGGYFVISGLKDKTVEDSINAQIKGLFDSLYLSKELPGYTGIKLNTGKFSEDECRYDWVGMEYFSCDNILSIVATHTRSFQHDSENWEEYAYFGYTVTETLNFDLNSGKQILLQDLFADSIDYEEYINEKVYSALDRNDAIEEGYSWISEYDVSLVAPFSGIKYDQKYYINSYSGELVLVFDDETPEFLITSYPVPLSFNIQDAIAYKEKFAGDFLFEDDTPRYSMYQNSYSEANSVSDNIYDEDYFNEDISISADLKWNTEAPAAAIEIASQRPYDDISLQVLLDEYLECAKDYSTDDLYAYADYYSNVGRYGKYPYVTYYRSKYINNQVDWSTLFSQDSSQYYCFDENGTQLELTDVFNCNEEEMKALIFKAWMKNAEADSQDIVNQYDNSLFYDCFEDAYNNISGFYLADDEIYFSFLENTGDICSRYFPEGEALWGINYSLTFANYDDIGCDKLNIFK